MKTTLLKHEKEVYNNGKRFIAGVDEAGRGPLAGPIVAAAVILDLNEIFEVFELLEFEYRNNDVSLNKTGRKKNIEESRSFYFDIDDSKKLLPAKRELLYNLITTHCMAYHIFLVESAEIDTIGIAAANNKALYEAVSGLGTKPDFILTDHYDIKMITKEHQRNITKGDSVSISIAAASILAKVYRDRIMQDMHTLFPQYNFGKHKGYGTKEHVEKIYEYGPCEIHRKSFEPVKSLILGKL